MAGRQLQVQHAAADARPRRRVLHRDRHDRERNRSRQTAASWQRPRDAAAAVIRLHGIARPLTRVLLVVHRWLGVALCVLFLIWFPSGIGMMYWDFPSVT